MNKIRGEKAKCFENTPLKFEINDNGSLKKIMSEDIITI